MAKARPGKTQQLTTADFVRLASFRRALRRFLHFSEEVARRGGLSAQQYQALLAVRGNPDHERVTINDLARHLLIKHNSAVGLVDRLAQEKLIVRETSSADRRKVELRLTPRGREVLAKLAAMHRAELQRVGPLLGRFFAELSRPPR